MLSAQGQRESWGKFGCEVSVSVLLTSSPCALTIMNVLLVFPCPLQCLLQVPEPPPELLPPRSCLSRELHAMVTHATALVQPEDAFHPMLGGYSLPSTSLVPWPSSDLFLAILCSHYQEAVDTFSKGQQCMHRPGSWLAGSVGHTEGKRSTHYTHPWVAPTGKERRHCFDPQPQELQRGTQTHS